MFLKSTKIFKFPKITKAFTIILLITMILTISTACSSNNFKATKLSDDDTYAEGIYPKIATINMDKNDYTEDKINDLARYSMLIVPATILKEQVNIISKIKQKNSKIMILMYQSSLYDISRNAQNNIKERKIEESWYYHKAETYAGQPLEQRRVLVEDSPVINMGGELTKKLISDIQIYKELYNVDGIYFDNFRTRFNSNAEFQADINNDGKDESYFDILNEYADSLNKILAEAKTIVGDKGQIVVCTNSWFDGESIIRGYTGSVDRSRAEWLIRWGRGNPIGIFGTVVALLDNAMTNNMTHILQEDIAHDIEIKETETLTFDLLTNDDIKVARLGVCISMMGESYFMITSRNSQLWFKEYDADIGGPKGQYTSLINHLHIREFKNGVVIINPNPGPVEHIFTEDYTDITSGDRGKTFSIPAKDGRIFKKN